MTTFGRIAPGDGSIMIFPPIHPFGKGWRFIHKFLSVKRADKVLSGTSTERASGIEITNQHPFFQFRAFDRKFDQVGTFPHTTMRSLAFTEFTLHCPILQIGRRIDLHLLPYRQDHNPSSRSFMPQHFRITEVTLSGSQYRVAGIFPESLSIIQAIRHALHLTVAR